MMWASSILVHPMPMPPPPRRCRWGVLEGERCGALYRGRAWELKLHLVLR